MRKELTTNDLKMLDKYIPTNNPKLELNGVFFDGERNAIVATDTKALIVLHIEHDHNIIVKGGTVKIASRIGTPKNPERFELMTYTDDTESTPALYGGFVSKEDIVLGRKINGKYPDWTRIVKDTDESSYSVNGEKSYTGEGDNRMKLPDMQFIDTHPDLLYHAISKTGTAVDERYVKPITDYCKNEGIYEVTVMVRETSMPVQVFCSRFILVIMPIVYEN